MLRHQMSQKVQLAGVWDCTVYNGFVGCIHEKALDPFLSLPNRVQGLKAGVRL